jgi:hypothetical protein
MKSLRHAACVVLAAASLLAAPAHATSFSTDQSDLYYIATESGWGIQLVQRGSVIFATLFVYGSNGQPTWYTATMDYQSDLTWSGDLYATTGPYFETVPFDPSMVTRQLVGTMTWQAPFVEGGTLTYVVNGVTIVKNVTRQSLVLDDFSGHFAGGTHSDIGSCTNPNFNGTVENFGTLDVSQNGTAILLQTTTAALNCSYSGMLNEFGQMGEVNGTYACSDGSGGTIFLFEMQVNETGITGRFSATAASPAGCQSTGWFGGVIVTTF